MRTIKYFIVLGVMAMSTFSQAQSPLSSFLDSVRKYNPVLVGARAAEEAEKAQGLTGLTPSDPVLEMGYLVGNPQHVGKRTDFSITQEFDFPSAYYHRRQISGFTENQASMKRKLHEQEVLCLAQKTWIEGIYLKRKQQLLTRRMQMMQLLDQQYQRQQTLGEISPLQANQVKLQFTALKINLEDLLQEIEINQQRLSQLSGNKAILHADTVYAKLVLRDPDSLLRLFTTGPGIQLFQVQKEKRLAERKLVIHEKLPSFTAGYYSEHILNTSLKGFQGGIRLPLWQHHGKLRAANASVLSAEEELKEQESLINQWVTERITRWISLNKQVNLLSSTLASSNDEVLLEKARQAGEINLSSFFYESEFYYQTQMNLLEYEKELHQTEADLLRIRF